MSETDGELIARYVRQNAEDAFAELVRRHVDLVYSAALRQVASPQLAEEVAQATFLKLARQARLLTPDTVITAWLYQVTRREAIDVVRREARRQLREQIAAEMNAMNATTSDWTHIAPLLDEAMHALDHTDRTAVLLRYFENKSLREVGQSLGASEDAAQKRVSRAVDRLREFFLKRGVKVGASGLVGLVSTHAVAAAPIGLSASITAAAASAGIPVLVSTTATATKTLLMTTLEKTLVAIVVAGSLAAPLLVYQRAQAKLRGQDELLEQQATQLASLRQELERTSNLLSQAKLSVTPANDQSNSVLKLRDEVGRLLTDVRELAHPKPPMPPSRSEVLSAMAGFYSEQVSQLKRAVENDPAEKTPELQFLTDEDWLWLAHKSSFETEEAHRQAMSLTRRMAEGHIFHDVLKPALREYAQANEGRFPANIAELKPWFEAPVDEAVLARWTILPKDRLAEDLQSQLQEDWFITQKAPVNATLDQRYLGGLNETHLFADGPPHWWIVK